jgi:hypothetical protein
LPRSYRSFSPLNVCLPLLSTFSSPPLQPSHDRRLPPPQNPENSEPINHLTCFSISIHVLIDPVQTPPTILSQLYLPAPIIKP